MNLKRTPERMEPERFPVAKIFLCHSSTDKQTVREGASYLRKANLEVWLDEREIRPGDSLLDRISDGLTSADYLLAFLSEASTNSSWVKVELNAALVKKLEASDIEIIPIVIEECDIPTLLLEYGSASV